MPIGAGVGGPLREHTQLTPYQQLLRGCLLTDDGWYQAEESIHPSALARKRLEEELLRDCAAGTPLLPPPSQPHQRCRGMSLIDCVCGRRDGSAVHDRAGGHAAAAAEVRDWAGLPAAGQREVARVSRSHSLPATT